MTVFDLMEKLMDFHADDVVTEYSFNIDQESEVEGEWNISFTDEEERK